MKDTLLARELARLANIIERVTPPIPAIPAIPPIIPTGDHELLQRLDVKVDGLKNDIKELSTGTSNQINDHEIRIRENTKEVEIVKTQLKAYASILTVGLTALSLILHYWR